MSNPKQTMAVGSTMSAEDFGAFGVAGLSEVATPERSFGQVVGEAGVGKTSIYLGFPGALIINTDCHSAPRHAPDAPAAKCSFFPAKLADGTLVDEKGKSVNRVTWDMFERLKDHLIEAAKNNKPRPTTIVIDTVAPCIPLYREYIARKNFSKYGGKLEDIPEGPLGAKAWGLAYDGLTKFFMDLMFAGYGVHLIAHVMTYEVSVPSEGGGLPVSKFIYNHNVPSKLYDRYFPALEFFIGIAELTVPIDVMKNGKKTGTKRVTKRFIVNKAKELNEKARSRVTLPDKIELPDPHSCFDAFIKAYKDASETSTS